MLSYLVRAFLCFMFVSCFSLENQLTSLSQLTIEQAEVIAIENNRVIASLKELYFKAKEGRLESLSKWWPKVEAMSVMYGLEKYSTVSMGYSAFETQVSLSQAILSTNRYYDVKISSLIVEQLELLLNAAIIDVLYQVRTSYYQVILDIENIAAAKEKVDLLYSLSIKAKDSYKIGTNILYGVNQSKVAISNATTYYYEQISQKKSDIDHLVNILGYIPGSIEVSFPKILIPVEEIKEIQEKLSKMQVVFNKHTSSLEDEIFTPHYPLSEERVMSKLYSKEEISKWQEVAMKYTPNVKVHENYVKIADKQVQKAKGTYLPEARFRFNVGGNPSTVQNLPTNSFGNQKMYWGAGVELNWLVFDGLGRERRVKQAQYEKRSKQYVYEQQVQITYEQVRKKIYQIEESVANYISAQANVALAEQTINLTSQQLDVGYSTIYDCQISYDQFIQALNGKNKARFELIKAYFGLKHASGADLEEKNVSK